MWQAHRKLCPWGLLKKSGDARPHTVGTKQTYRAYCGVCMWKEEGGGVVKRAQKKETGNSDTSQ